MTLDSDIDPAFSNNADTKRVKLIDMIINHRRDVQRQINNRIQELICDPSKNLIVSKPYNEERQTFIIKCDSSYDMKIWNLCLMHVHLKLNISMTSFKRKDSTYEYPVKDFSRIFKFLEPLIQRSRYIEENSEFSEILSYNNQLFENLLDSVLVQFNDDTEILIANWEELKIAHKKAMTAREFMEMENGSKRKTEVLVSCNSIESYTLWKSALTAAVFVLGIPEMSIYSFYFGKPNDMFAMDIFGTMSSIDLGRVFNLLKPLADAVYIESFICDVNAEVVKYFTEFFEKGSIDSVDIPDILKGKNRNCVSFTPWFEFVQKVRPLYVTYTRLGIDTDAENMLALADLTENLCITECTGTLEPLSVSAIRRIFERKCVCLVIYDQNTVPSLEEVEELIEFVHHQSKKLSLEINTSTAQVAVKVETQVGEYLNQLFGWSRIVEHMDFDKQFSRLF